MSPEAASIPLSRIDVEDITYRVSTDRDDRLSESIRDIGQLQAVRLIGQDGRYTILSGFRRVAACAALGRPHVRARIYPPQALDAPRRCLLAIGDNVGQRPLNAVETSRAVALLHRETADERALADGLQRLGFPRNPAWISQQLELAALSDPILKRLLDGTIGVAMALDLATLETADAVALTRVFASLRLGLNRQREVFGICRDLARRDRTPIREIVTGAELRRLLNDDAMDMGEKNRQFRRRLKQQRYPQLTAAEDDFSRILKSLSLGEGIRLVPPPFFEGGTYQLSIAFDSVDALSRRLQDMTDKAASPHMRRLLQRGPKDGASK
jgi:ParB family chromosome partitioning protein